MDIREYTLAQFREFAEAARRALEMERAIMLQTVALGAQGSPKAITETLEKLIKAAK